MRGAVLRLLAGLAGVVAGWVGVLLGSGWLALAGGLLGVAGFGEVAVYGVEAAAEALGLSGGAAVVVVNGLAVFPELLLAYSVGSRGLAAGEPVLVELSVLSVVVGAGFAVAVLGVVAVLGGGLPASAEGVAEAVPLLRATVASMGVVVLYALVEASYVGGVPASPVEASVVLLLFYAVYMWRVAAAGRGRGTGGWGWVPWLAAGLAGLLAASEAMASGVEAAAGGLPVGAGGLLLGLVGVAPEAALGLASAARGRVVEAGAGLLASVAATVLLVFAGLGVLLPLPLDRYVVYSLGVLAAALWLAERSLETGGALDRGEALLVALLAAGALSILARV